MTTSDFPLLEARLPKLSGGSAWMGSFAASAAALLLPLFANGQSCNVSGRAVSETGAAIAGARIAAGASATYTDTAGHYELAVPCAGAKIELTASAPHLVADSTMVDPGTQNVAFVLRSIVVQQSTSVTATRSLVEIGPAADTITTLSASDLTQYPALTLDERLRQQAGFELFRRSSTWVANPTSEGISLRGLGSTAASRTLVLTSGAPLNDPFGGWIHWNEMPPETIAAVTLASGGGSDLYGSSALGGVIDVVSEHPDADSGPALATVDLAAASEDTTDFSARADAQKSKWYALVASQVFRTAGYTVVAPAVRGAVDVPSNVHFQNGHVEADRSLAADGRLFLTGNVLNEARNNGTALQTNGTRLWRYIAGADWTAGSRVNGRVRGFGSDEAYRQSFSAIADATRSSESLSRSQRVETQEFGASADASFHLTHLALIGGGDLRDLRATDVETPYLKGAATGLLDTSARQRFFGGFGEVLAERGRWSGAASLRTDEAENLATRALTQTATQTGTQPGSPPGTQPPVPTPTADRHEVVLSPRLGLVGQLPNHFDLHLSAFRAFRSPTMNELYRTGQVGQLITLPNSALTSERATGAEGGARWASGGNAFAAQATYFWTEINRPVSAILISGTRYQRENLGQIQSQGVELAAQMRLAKGLSADFGYVYAHATVTAFKTQPMFVGLWIPEVPRHSATAQVRYRPTNALTFTTAVRQIGHAFDDSSNMYKLHGFFVLDAYAEARITHLDPRLTVYASFQNLLNRSIETARTPTLTLGTPFIAQGGVRFMIGNR